MSTSTHSDHLFTVCQLAGRAQQQATRQEALQQLAQYHNEGIILQDYGKEYPVAKKTKKTRAHEDTTEVTFSGQGIMFAVIDDREAMGTGRHSTVSIIADAIEAALDAGHETSEEIARYLTTSTFAHEPDKRVRFNSVLKAGDAVGAQIVSKLHNAYNDLEVLADEEEDPEQKKSIRTEALGFAEALNVVMSPFSCEDDSDPRLVDWDEVDRITEHFVKEQRQVRRERKGNPQ